MKSRHRDTPLYVTVPQPADRPYRRETEQRLAENVSEDERAAFREWLAHVQAGRIGGGQ